MILIGAPVVLIGAPIVLVGAPMVLVGAPIVLIGAPNIVIGFGIRLKKKVLLVVLKQNPAEPFLEINAISLNVFLVQLITSS
jgi:hypothetical protein